MVFISRPPSLLKLQRENEDGIITPSSLRPPPPTPSEFIFYDNNNYNGDSDDKNRAGRLGRLEKLKDFFSSLKAPFHLIKLKKELL